MIQALVGNQIPKCASQLKFLKLRLLEALNNIEELKNDKD